MDPAMIYETVRFCYSASANAAESPSYGKSVAEAFGYSTEDLASVPSESNLGLSCGNPIALANLKGGETVIDLGSGAGFDVFLAAQRVGEKGKVMGIDMNEDMVTKARRNSEKANIKNVEFILSKITELPLHDTSVDVVISNCVINLVPHDEKHFVFREIFRVLKPGGRAAISDILTKKALSEQMKNDVALYVGCVAGATGKEEYEMWLKESGFKEVVIVDTGADLNVYTQCGENGEEKAGRMCCGPVAAEKMEGARGGSSCSRTKKICNDGGVVMDMKANHKDIDLNEWAGSYKILAVKA